MMLGSILGFVLAGQATAPIKVDATLTAASVYKNGLVMTVREAVLKEGANTYELTAIPLAYEGSFWPQPSEGIEVGDLTSKLEMVQTKVNVAATTVGQLIEFNLGRTVTVVLPMAEGKTKRITGRAMSFVQNSLTMQDDQGVVRAIPIYGEVGLVAKGLTMSKEVTRTQPRIRLSFRANAKPGARLKFVALEQGAAWSNHYLLDLKGGSARLAGKATIGLGSLKLDSTKVDLVAGQPAMSISQMLDFGLGGQSLTDYLNRSGQTYLKGENIDPYELMSQIMQREEQNFQKSATTESWGDVGGFGGGMGGLSNGGVAYDSPPPASSPIVGMAPAQQVEDAYVIGMGRLTLNPGDRLTRLLYDKERPIERLFTAATQLGSNESRMEVSNVIKIKNDGEAAWTAGPILVISQATPQAVVPMPFTAPGASAELLMGNAEDVLASSSSTVTNREVIRVDNGVPLVRATVEMKMTAVNRRRDAARVKLWAAGPGVLVDADGAETQVRPGQRDPLLSVSWHVDLQPGQEKTVVCHYTVYE